MLFGFAAIPFGEATAQDKTADVWVTAKVKSEFGTTKGVSATDISVSINDGVGVLSGT